MEGDEATVTSVYAMIEKDDRHKEVTMIQKEIITERAFPSWSLGFDKIDAEELNNTDGLNYFFEHDFTPIGFASHVSGFRY